MPFSSNITKSETNAIRFANNTTIKLKSNIPPDRNRRLIPYMTFYVPTNEYPTNQQYETDSNNEQNSEKNQSPNKHPTLAIYQQQTHTPLAQHQQYHQEASLNRLPPQYHQHQYHHKNAPSYLRLPMHNINLNRHHHSQQYVMQPVTSVTSEGYPTALTPPKIIFNQYKGNNNEYIGITTGNGEDINHSQNGHLRNQFYHNQHLENENKEGHIILKDNSMQKTKQQLHGLNKPHPVVLIGNNNPIGAYRIQNPKQQMTFSVFKESNKIPGDFTPIIYNTNNNQVGNNPNQDNQQIEEENNLNEGEITKENRQYDDKQSHNVIHHNQYSEEAQNQAEQNEQTKQNEEEQYYQYQEVSSNSQEGHDIKNANNNQPENTNTVSSPSLQKNPNYIEIVQNVIVSSTQRPQYHLNPEHHIQQNEHHSAHHIQQNEHSVHHIQQNEENSAHHIQQNEQHSAQHIQQNEQHNGHHIQQNEHHSGHGHLQQNEHHSGHGHHIQQNEQHSEQQHKLTPQERYVAYLQQQFKQNQHAHHEQYPTQDNKNVHNQQQINQHELKNYNQDLYLLHPSASPLPENHINYVDNKQKSPNAQHYQRPVHQPAYIYTSDTSSQSEKNTDEKEIILIQPQQELLRPQIAIQANEYFQRIPSMNKNQNLNYVPSENPKVISPPPPLSSPNPQGGNENRVLTHHGNPSPEKNNFKSIVFVTTPQPILVTSIGSIYKNQPVQRLHPISTSQPIFESNSPTRITQKINLVSSTPKSQIFLIKPSTDIPIEHQHLTETTSPRPRPVRPLPRYHSRYHKFQPSVQSSTVRTPLKLTPSQKYEPFDVTQAVEIKTSSATTTMAPPSLPTRYSKNYPQLQHHPHAQTSEQKLNDNYPNLSYPDLRENSLAEILRKLQESNHLPQTITADNIDNSINTLIKILNNLKESQTIVDNPSQYHEPPATGNGNSNDDDYSDTPVETPDPSHPGPNSGRPGIDYPALAEIPATKFSCKEQRYKGFFGDPETNCQVWHYCDLNGGQASFLCPNGTIFSQVALTCDWWFNVKCSSTAQLYVLNERLYKYILPFTPKFPEDYSGPLVDKYLALKFKEMEEKMTREKLKGREQTESNGDETKISTETETETEIENNASKEESSNPVQKEEENNEESYENDNSSNLNNEEITSVNLEDVENNRGSVDTGIPYNKEYAKHKLRPIVVSTTLVPSTLMSQATSSASPALESGTENSSAQYYSSTTSTTRQPLKAKHYGLRNAPAKDAQRVQVEVESEKVEVIEIKTDGSTGHLIPPHDERF